MAAFISLETQGTEAIEQRLGALARAFGDLSPLMESFGLTLESFTIDRFDTATAPDGTPWQKSIRARLEGGKTLTDSGILRSSFHSIAGSDRVEHGTNMIYAGVHNDGRTIRAKSSTSLMFRLPGGLGFRRVPEVTMPKRQIIGMSAELDQELTAQAEDYARDAGGEGFE